MEGSVLRTIIRLAGPTVIGSLSLMSVGIMQLYFVGLLGVEALAGVTLVFPALTLMQLTASSGIGAGVASAVARGIGAGRRADAEALVLNALFLAIVGGIAFAAAGLLLGPGIYRWMGGTGGALAASVAYSNWIFAASVVVWILGLLLGALVGCGNTLVPLIASLSALAMVPLSPALMFGWGPLPPLGIAGAGLAFAVYYLAASIALIGYYRSGHAPLRLSLDIRLIQRRLLMDILRVGAPAALAAAIPIFSIGLITAAVGRFGINEVAGYGIAIRADYMLLPLYVGICAGIVPMVGTNVGAGQIRRARQIAWTGALMAAGIGGFAGLALALAPSLWVGLFSHDPKVAGSGALYFHIVGIQFPLSALAVVLSAAAQAAGRASWPLAAITSRLTVAAGGSWLVVSGFDGSLEALYAMLAIGSICYCGVISAGQIAGLTIPDRT